MKQKNFPFPTNYPSPAVLSAAQTGHEYMALARANVKQQAEEERVGLLDAAKKDNVGIVHIYSTDCPNGGLTVAFRKSNEYSSGVMVDVAVQVCSKEDTFSKKIGVVGALNKFFEGEVIQLPLLTFYTPDMLNHAVKQAFTAMYESIA